MSVENHAARADAIEFENYDYTQDDFATEGEVTQLNGFKVLCGHGSCDHSAEFQAIQEMRRSDWQPNYGINARLTDGTILYQGFCPDHRIGAGDWE